MIWNWQSPSDKRVLARRDIRVRQAPSQQLLASAYVVVGVTLRNQAEHLPRCLRSIIEQRVGDRQVLIVILNDGSEDDWMESAAELLRLPNLIILDANCGSAARARNAILDFVDASLPNVRWVARLDADDRFTSPESLAAAMAAGEKKHAQFVLGGNRLFQDGMLLTKANSATAALRNPQHVLSQLQAMAAGTAENELPSCNLLLARSAGWRYPDVSSAEDHWLVADLLANHTDDGAILPAPFYCDYSLKGAASQSNGNSGDYLRSRRALCEAAENWIATHSSPGDVLGYGREGVVRLIEAHVEKQFHKGAISAEKVSWLEKTLRDVAPFLPEPSWFRDGDRWRCIIARSSLRPPRYSLPRRSVSFCCSA